MSASDPLRYRFHLAILGMPEVDRALAELPGKASKRLVRSSLRAGGKIILAAVLAAVPKDTGALRNSIKLRSGGFSRGLLQMRIYTGDLKTLGYRLTREPGKRGGHKAQGYPPAAIEFGFTRGGKHSRRDWVAEIVDSLGRARAVKRVTRSTTGGTRVPPRSFIRAPLEAVRQDAIDAIGKDLAEGLEELRAGKA